MSSNSNSKGGGKRNRGSRRSPPRKSDPEPKKNTPRRIPNKLYIGDLLDSVKKEDLEREFSRFGKLREVWLAHHPPGFAFVEFVSNKDAADVIDAFDGKMLCGSKVRVEYAKANGPANAKRPKRRDPPARTSSSSSSLLLGRISPLLSLPLRHSSLLSSSTTNRPIPPLLSLCQTSSPPRRGRDDLRYKEVEPLSVWDRSTSPVPLLPPPRYRSRHSPLGRDRSPPSYRDMMPPPLLSPTITRDLHRAYPLLPPPPPPLPLLSSRSSRDSRARSPVRERSRSPVYIRRPSPPTLLPSRGRLLGRTPPPLPHERTSSVERRYSPRRSRSRDSPARLVRSPPIRRGSPMSRSPVVGDRRASPAKYRVEASSHRHGRNSYSHGSSPGAIASNYLPRAYAPSPRKDRSPSSPRQFQSTSRHRKGFSGSPRGSQSPHTWSRTARSRSPVIRRNVPSSPSPKRFRREASSRSPSVNGHSISRRSYVSPVKRYSPVGRGRMSMSPSSRDNRRRSVRRSNSMDYRPRTPSPKRFSAAGSRSPPIVRSPSPYRPLSSRQSPSRGRSPLRGRSPVTLIRGSPLRNRGRTPPRMYRQESPRYRLSPPVRTQMRKSPPFRSPARSDRSLSSRRGEHRSPKGSPLPRMNPRTYAQSPSSRSTHSYRKGSSPVIRRGSPMSQRSSSRSKRISPVRMRGVSPRNSASYARRSPPLQSLRPGRNSRMSVSPPPAQMLSRMSRSVSRSPVHPSQQGSVQRSNKVTNHRRRFSMERSPSPRRSRPRSRCSPTDNRRRASPPGKIQSLYRSPSPQRNSPVYRKSGPPSSTRSPRAASPSPLVRGSRRSRSSSGSRRMPFSPKTSSHAADWSPPRRLSPPARTGKSHMNLASWEDSKRFQSPKRKSPLSPPPAMPPSPPQRHHRHKSKKMKA